MTVFYNQLIDQISNLLSSNDYQISNIIGRKIDKQLCVESERRRRYISYHYEPRVNFLAIFASACKRLGESKNINQRGALTLPKHSQNENFLCSYQLLQYEPVNRTNCFQSGTARHFITKSISCRCFPQSKNYFLSTVNSRTKRILKNHKAAIFSKACYVFKNHTKNLRKGNS